MQRVTLCLAMGSALIFSSAAVQADYEAGGHLYDLKCTNDGYQLTSKYPVSRTTGTGATTQRTTGKEVLYLGRSCDSFHQLYGTGTWCWANGGFAAEFADMRFGFGRQELWCEPEQDYGQNCRC